MNKLFHTVLLALTVAVAACGGEKIVLHAQPVDSAGVHVQPLDIYVGGKKLWVRLSVTNSGTGTLIVQRDAVVAHTPNGQTIGRAQGTYGLHEPYVIPAGGMHLVYVEFEEQGFKWKDMPSATIDFANAVTRDGQPVVVTPFAVSR
jgi:hypothetical protein